MNLQNDAIPNSESQIGRPHTADAIEEWLIRQLAEQLHVHPDDIDIREPFNHYGLESKQALILLAHLETFMGISLTPALIWNYPSIDALTEYFTAAQTLSTPAPVRPLKDLKAEIFLDPSIDTAGLPNAVEMDQYDTAPSAVLLTGATGFLGAFLLHGLLQQSQADIYCLVRSANIVEGKRRLRQHLESYELWDERLNARIIPVVGDLSRPLLGFTHEEFRKLAGEIDVIYHSGALLNFNYGYDSLKATNVLGTQEILRLASQVKIKPVHYISTMGVFLSMDFPDIQKIQESSDLDITRRHAVGYLQSKWVAEQQVAIAQSRGLPVSIYRPTWISGHSQTGVCNTDDFVCTLIKGCLQLGSAPYLDMTLDMVPVDYASQAIIHLSRQKGSLGQAFHLCQPRPQPWNRIVDWMIQSGYALKQLPYQAWRAELIYQSRSALGNVLHPFLSAFSETIAGTSETVPDIYLQNRWPEMDFQKTLRKLEESATACPPIDAELLEIYFSYLIKSKFLFHPLSQHNESEGANEHNLFRTSDHPVSWNRC